MDHHGRQSPKAGSCNLNVVQDNGTSSGHRGRKLLQTQEGLAGQAIL